MFDKFNWKGQVQICGVTKVQSLSCNVLQRCNRNPKLGPHLSSRDSLKGYACDGDAFFLIMTFILKNKNKRRTRLNVMTFENCKKRRGTILPFFKLVFFTTLNEKGGLSGPSNAPKRCKGKGKGMRKKLDRRVKKS